MGELMRMLKRVEGVAACWASRESISTSEWIDWASDKPVERETSESREAKDEPPLRAKSEKKQGFAETSFKRDSGDVGTLISHS